MAMPIKLECNLLVLKNRTFVKANFERTAPRLLEKVFIADLETSGASSVDYNSFSWRAVSVMLSWGTLE